MIKIYNIYSKYINKVRTYILDNRDKAKAQVQAKLRKEIDQEYINIDVNQFKNHDLSKLWSRKRINKTIDILTIAYNNSETIATQFNLLSRNLKDDFCFIVVDNSTEEYISKQIAHFCSKNTISYVRLMNNPYNGKDLSRSHGIALNWAYYNLIQKSKARYFGTIDHDIYPIKKTKLISLLSTNEVWGHYQERISQWYIWPGLCFFDRKAIVSKKVDFLPSPGLDTGGGNWETIYKHIDKGAISWPTHKYVRYRKGETIQNTHVELIGDWLHLINASGWKDGKIKGSIDKLIKKIMIKAKDV